MVVNAPMPVLMVPIQTCAQVVVTSTNVTRFEEACGCGTERQMAGCALVPKMRQQVRNMHEPGAIGRTVSYGPASISIFFFN